MSWHQLESRAYLLTSPLKTFGPTNTLALGAGDGLVIVSPNPGMREEGFRFVERLGGVAGFVVPSAGHNLGVAEWQKRFPEAKAYAPRAALSELVNEGVKGIYPLDGMPDYENLSFRELPGTKIGGVLAISEHGERPVVYADELLVHLGALPKATLPKILFFLMRGGPGLNMNRVYLKRLVRDPSALAESYLPILEGHPILVPAHGRLVRTEMEIAQVRSMLQKLITSVAVRRAS